MNPENPLPPREQTEIRLTALLLGELSHEEAAALHLQMAGDPQLAALHAQLRQAMALLREACVIAPQSGAPAPARLSGERRARLLAHFKRPAGPTAVIPLPRRSRWVPMAQLAAIFLILAVVALPTFLRSRKRSSATAILEEVRLIDAAKDQYAIENGTSAAAPAWADLLPYLKKGTRLYNLAAPPTEELSAVSSAEPAEQPAAVAPPPTTSPDSQPSFLTANSKAPEQNLFASVDELHFKNLETPQGEAGSDKGQFTDGVKWLNVHRDGQLAGSDIEGFAANPITGRIAYWNDDESAKLKVDTAAEGTFWDTPAKTGKAREAQNSGAGESDGKEDAKRLMADADAYFQAGRYDMAAKRSEQALGIDSTNIAARKLLENVDAARNHYAFSAYNEARSRAIWKVDQAWGSITAGHTLAVDPDKDGFTNFEEYPGKSEVDAKHVEIAQNNLKELDFDWLIGSSSIASTSATAAATPVNGALAADPQRQIALGKEKPAPAPPAKPAVEEDAPKPAARPPADAAVPQPEIATVANAFSNFSLNVSDVSFKLAAASLEQNRMPDPASVRSEEFLNALDYHDPQPGAGAPLAFAAERARYPFAQNRDLLRLSVKTAAAGRQPGRPLNLVLLLDNSGSMERADRVRIVHEALRVLAAQLQPQDKLSIVTFARTPRLWADGVAGNEAGALSERISEIPPQGGTDLGAALELGYQTALRHFQTNSINRVVLLTDGAANLGDVNPDGLKQKVETFRKQGVALDCFGIGWEDYDDTLLEALSRNGDGRYGFINTPEEATTGFAAQLAGALQVAASDVKVQVEFNPRRVTAYRQIGYAKHQLKKEQFRDNTVDAAEIGAAESGNALYVVEVNPAGQGELATVRVRFKVPGTNDYKEHEWKVPFDHAAEPLVQASPALRLAATASAFAEWLVSSPYASEVTTDQLLGLIRGVPATYGADPRPKKLEWMIRQAKSLTGR